MIVLKNQLHCIMFDRHINFDDLSDKTGISKLTLKSILLGDLVPSITVALLISYALNCKVEDIFELSVESDEEVSEEFIYG